MCRCKCVCIQAAIFCACGPGSSNSAHCIYHHLDLLHCLSLENIWHLQSLSATLANYCISLSRWCSEKGNCRQCIKKNVGCSVNHQLSQVSQCRCASLTWVITDAKSCVLEVEDLKAVGCLAFRQLAYTEARSWEVRSDQCCRSYLDSNYSQFWSTGSSPHQQSGALLWSMATHRQVHTVRNTQTHFHSFSFCAL